MLQFSPLQSAFHPEFWQELTRLKLFEFKLSDAPVTCHGSYNRARATVDRQTGEKIGFGCVFEELSFSPPKVVNDQIQLRGTLRNYNTIEEFKLADKNAIIESAGREVNKPHNLSISLC